MNRFDVLVKWSNADESFIAVVPELPGCMADGQTMQDALANTCVVINEWIETAKEINRWNK